MSNKNLDELNDADFKAELNRLLDQPQTETPAPEVTPEVTPEETPEVEVPEVPVEEAPEETSEPESEESAEAPTEETETQEVPASETAEEVDYKAFYERVTAPFKANGTEYTVTSPEELIKLKQMGINYTQKLQRLSPHLKIVKMLEKEDLLDESKLNQLIDISKKNPQAIAKLVQDSGIDPLSIDPEEANKYVPNRYEISEEEFKLQTVLDEVLQDPDGAELLKGASNWDNKTKLDLQKAPEQLYALVEQKKNGTYDLITRELERQKLFNPQIAMMPFLDAYQAVGYQLLQQAQAQIPQQPVAPVAVRPAVPAKPAVVPNVKAAAPVRNSPPSPPKASNLDAIKDDLEFTQELKKLLYNR